MMMNALFESAERDKKQRAQYMSANINANKQGAKVSWQERQANMAYR